MESITSEEAFDIRTYLVSEGREVEAALETALGEWDDVLGPELMEPVRHGVLSGGKRLRPILCATAYRAVGGSENPTDVYAFAVSLELIHAYSLMHDDLPCMDDAELRRGRPTTHRAHGVRSTSVAGFMLIPMAGRQAYRAALNLGRSQGEARALAGLLCDAAGSAGMVGGQALDLEGEERALSSEQLDQLHSLKTGALLAGALTLGALVAGAASEKVAALTSYGRAIGLAFQVADDVLDATSSAEELGKRPSDADHDKSTYVALYGLDEAVRRSEGLVAEAIQALSSASIDDPALTQLARYVIERRR